MNNVVGRLAVAEFGHHRVRTMLTVFSVCLAVALIVAMTSGFNSLHAAARGFVVQYFGTTDVQVKAGEESSSEVNATLLKRLQDDKDVKVASGELRFIKPVLRKSGRPTNRVSWIVGMHAPGSNPGSAATMLNDGRWFTAGEKDVVVVDQELAEYVNLELGDMVLLPVPNGKPVRKRVIGLAAKPRVMAFRKYTIYMPIGEAQGLHDIPDAYSEISVDLKAGVDRKAFVARWKELLAATGKSVQLRTVDSMEDAFNRNMQGLVLVSYLGGVVSLLAAGFIVFSTVSMGLTERMRVLAMLRAVGATRKQVGSLVVVEALLIGVVGIVGGVLLGWAVLAMVVSHYDKWFLSGVVFSYPGMLFAVVGMLVVTLGAGVIPAVGASRVDPLAALTPLAQKPKAKLLPLCFVLGLVCLFADFAVIRMGAIPADVRMWFHVGVGVPLLLIGLFLISPVLIKGVEAGLGPVVAKLMGVDRFLLRQQLGSAVWRAAGTVSALMVGLLILVLMQMHGRGMLQSWQLPNKFPDMLVYAPLGLNDAQRKQLDELAVFERGQVLPVAWASPELGGEINMFAISQMLMMPQATIMLGMDMDRAFGMEGNPEKAMVELDFVQGDPVEAARKMKAGRHVLVSTEFNRLGDVKVGDKFPVKTARFGEVEYTVAGVVRAIGVDVIVRVFNIGSEMQRWTAGSVIANIDDMERDFGITRVRLFAANIRGDIEKEEVERAVRKELRVMGLLASDARRIKAGINRFFTNVLGLFSSIAMLATLVASLGVVNTIMAGIRSRQWQLGILRSIGLTRGQLLRLIVAEAVMLGLLAGLMGVAGGVICSFNAHQVAAMLVGIDAPTVWPVGMMMAGVGVTILIAVVAGLYPAVQVARTEVLTLLKASRSAA